MDTAQWSKWPELWQQWWMERTDREKIILAGGLCTVVLGISLLLGEALWRFYRTLPQQHAVWLQREWLIEDIRALELSESGKRANNTHDIASFLSTSRQVNVNGECALQGKESWLCSGQSATLEAVQQWWMSGRVQGFYVERFEATRQSPGRIRWTMLLKHSGEVIVQ